ncbi:MAG: type 4a pilus biogenesis protein PilO [Candidatus Acidiferrum sp.]|jgi:Tfp pilus assembly protein PilO
MHRDFTLQRRAILVVLGLLLAADTGLAIYSWHLASSPRTSQAEFDAQILQLKVLRGDIKSAEDIKDHMPATRKDCEKFEQSLLAESTSSSVVSADLDDIAKKAGLQILTLGVKEKEVENRGMTEMGLDATVNGDYGSVVRFVNGLQRSQRFYIVDSLALAADTQSHTTAGAIRVSLHLRTYLRNAA